MNKTLWKDIRRLIQATKGRFISLTAIVMIGVSFFVGISSVSTVMGYSVDIYDDDENLKDITIYSNYGFDEDDIKVLNEQEDVKKAEGVHFLDVMAVSGETTYITRIHSYSDEGTINQFVLVDGRMPENKYEVLAENGTDMMSGFTIGSTVTLTRPDNDLDDFLSVEEVTVVGTVDTPVYLNMTKENSTLSNQQLRTYLYIPEEAFIEDYFTEVDVVLNDTLEMDSFSDEYENYTASVKEKLETLGETQAEIRKQTVLDDALEEYYDGLEEYEDGLNEFNEKIADAEKEIADAEKKIADGQQEIADGIKELNDAEEEVNAAEIDGANQINSARAEITKGAETLKEGKEELAKQKEELQTTIGQIDSLLELLEGYKKAYSGLQQVNTTISSLDTIKNSLSTTIEGLRAAVNAKKLDGSASLEVLDKMYGTGTSSTLQQAVTGINTITSSLTGTTKEVKTIQDLIDLYDMTFTGDTCTYNTLIAQQKALQDKITELDGYLSAANITIDKTESQMTVIEQLDVYITEYTNNKQQINDGLASAEQQIADGEAQLEKAYAMTVNASVELDEKIADARKEIADNRQKISDSQQELADAKIELADAKQEFEDEKADGLQELEDAKADLDKAWQDIQDLEDASWTVLDRTEHYASATYKETIHQMQAIANIFPVFFLLVAALVCLTTMTRMVDEQRGQIGVLRALGYSELQCASKYLIYATLATILGEVLGCALGIALFPPIIYHLWRMMYILPDLHFEIPWTLVIASSIIFILVMLLTTWSACKSDTKEVPAQLLRPKAPKLGKSTFIEKIGFIWKHLTFTWKVTVRNLIRYKKRFFMTVFGVAGCTALLVTGWGVRDSVRDMVDIQYDEIIFYDGVVVAEEETSKSEFNSLLTRVQERDDVAKAIPVLDYSALMDNDSNEETVYVYAVENVSDLDGLVDMRTRIGHKPVTLDDSGIVISEKLAENMDLTIGDTIAMESENGVVKEVKVSGIIEMYIQHFVFMTQDYYESVFGVTADSNSILVEINGDDAVNVAFQRDIVKDVDVASITFNEAILNNFQTMANSLDLVVWVLLIASMSLAFVVLGNLTNVNISERQREIATLKVLGFRKKEVENYIYKENNVLTFIGAIVGIPVGTLLHHYIMRQVEMDYIMFGRSVQPISYAYSVFFTIAFGYLVNFVMRKKLKNIDMIESLKSVE